MLISLLDQPEEPRRVEESFWSQTIPVRNLTQEAGCLLLSPFVSVSKQRNLPAPHFPRQYNGLSADYMSC